MNVLADQKNKNMQFINDKNMQRKETLCALIVECFIIYGKRIQGSLINDLEKKKANINNDNHFHWSVFIQINILLVRINRNQLNYNKNEETHYSWIEEMK